MQIEQTLLFERAYKKLHKNQLSFVNQAIQKILETPDCGELKKGDLSSVRVYKFKVQRLIYLLAYEFDGETLILLLALGVHENFYRDLKKHRT